MTSTRADVVAYARTLEGLGADPSDADNREAYLTLIGPLETPARRAQMAQMSGCELVMRGILRRFIRHPVLEARYVTGHSGADLLVIGRDARGAPAWRAPEPGDILIIGGGPDGGGPEHAYMVLETSEIDDGSGKLTITGLDGGQRDTSGQQTIVIRDHEVASRVDRAENASDPGGGSRRKIRFVLDLGAILDRFGRDEPLES